MHMVCWRSVDGGSMLTELHNDSHNDREATKHRKQSCNKTRTNNEKGGGLLLSLVLVPQAAVCTTHKTLPTISCLLLLCWWFGASISMQPYRKICLRKIKCVTSQEKRGEAELPQMKVKEKCKVLQVSLYNKEVSLRNTGEYSWWYLLLHLKVKRKTVWHTCGLPI